MTVLKDGFERQTELLTCWDFGVEYASFVSNWTEEVWYKEHPTSLSSIVTEPVFEGSHALRLDSSPFKPGENRYGR